MPEPKEEKHRVLSLGELLKLPADTTFYLSRPLLPRGGRIVLGAPAKHFKSMLALNLAYDLAEGEPLWGLKKEDGSPLWPVKQPYSVLYAEAEIGRYRLKERMEHIHNQRQGEIALDNLHIIPKGSGIMLDSDFGLNVLKSRLEECKADVLIVDPLRKFHTRDENNSTEMVQIALGLDNLQEKYKEEQRRDLTIVILHHTGKKSEFRDPRDPESLRGSGLLFDDADTAIMLTRPVPTNKNKIQMDFVLRSGADPHAVRMEFDEETFLFKPVEK